MDGYKIKNCHMIRNQKSNRLVFLAFTFVFFYDNAQSATNYSQNEPERASFVSNLRMMQDKRSKKYRNKRVIMYLLTDT